MRLIPSLLATALACGTAAAQSPLTLAPASLGATQFGQSVSMIPDVNGDGVADLAIGAHSEAVGGNPHAGRVHLYSGATGALIRSINPPTAQPIGTFGWAVAGVPDANGDGRGDILVGGIWETDSAGLICGRAYLYSGATGGLLRAWLSPNRQQNGAFGWAVASIPDVNSDGVADFAIGGEGETVGAIAGEGRVYLYSGATGVYLRTLLSPTPQANEHFGFAIAGSADLNGDGGGEVIVGAPSDSTGRAGRVYIYSGRTGAFLRVLASGTPAPNGAFGNALSTCGDLNGDGKPEIVVAASDETNGATIRSGHVHIYAGGTWQLLRRISPPTPVFNGRFGSSISCTRSPAGAPLTTVLIGEPGAARAYGYAPAGAPTIFQSAQAPAGSHFGEGIAGTGNGNANGVADVLVGAPFDQNSRGAAFLFR
jgi:hypothetical protein